MVTGAGGPPPPSWRGIAKCAHQNIRPAWIREAEGFKGNPTAKQIANLADNLRSSFKIDVVLNGKEIKKEGLRVELGDISDKHAFQALVQLAKAGSQREPVTISLEDAASLVQRGIPLKLVQLSDIREIRQACEVLFAKGVTIEDKNKLSFHEMNAANMVAIMEVLEPRFEGKSLASVITLWVDIGWEGYHDKQPGAFTLEQIIGDVL
ncbi:MAG: hypothetical protein ABIH22_04720 [Candidatus Margulisiibacteriota bacterium]